MPYIFHWHDPAHSIIRIEITGEVMWEQWHSVLDDVVREISQHPDTRFDIILDDHVGMPDGNPIANLIATADRLATLANLELMVTVSPHNTSKFVKTIIETIGRAYRIRRDYYGGFVSTLDEALAIIAQDRANRIVPKP